MKKLISVSSHATLASYIRMVKFEGFGEFFCKPPISIHFYTYLYIYIDLWIISCNQLKNNPIPEMKLLG